MGWHRDRRERGVYYLIVEGDVRGRATRTKHGTWAAYIGGACVAEFRLLCDAKRDLYRRCIRRAAALSGGAS